MNFARAITCAFERLQIRGAPTLLRLLSRTPLAKRTATCALPGGVQLCFPRFDSYWARYLYAGVPYEPEVERILRQFSPGRTLIDCGANIGYWSARHRELGFVDAVAIEANPRLVPFLKRNHRGRVVEAAVHSTSGETLRFAGEGAAGGIAAHGQPVVSIALKDLGIVGPALVKLDVEGAEIAAFEGARGLDAIFVYEDWPRSGMPVTRYALEKGYTVRGFDETPIRSVDDALAFNARTQPVYGPSNFLAMR